MYTPEITTGSAGENRFEWNAAAEAAYWQQCEKIAYTDVSEITLTAFMGAIALMYPKDWQGDAHCESFKLAEMVCGDVTDIYAKIGERYFRSATRQPCCMRPIIRQITKEVLSKEETYQK